MASAGRTKPTCLVTTCWCVCAVLSIELELTIAQARELLGHLAKSPFAHPRVLFTGSIDGLPHYYDPDDPESADSGHSYQSSKFSCGLVAWGLNDAIAAHPDADVRRIRSFLVHPGVVAGNMFREIRASTPARIVL